MFVFAYIIVQDPAVVTSPPIRELGVNVLFPVNPSTWKINPKVPPSERYAVKLILLKITENIF